MKKPLKTQVYYTINGVPHYDEFKDSVPQRGIEVSIKTNNPTYNGKMDLFDLLMKNKEYKLCRDDGPAIHYSFFGSYWQSSKCLNPIYYNDYYNDYYFIDWAKNTNHLICKNCHGFCNQNCFNDNL